eukprot:CAMPEP_0183830646 /NCGR_PEP_ID=MMETSP0807_2-20130328/4145_1 /TAXON_ID=88271 /ORGANISM="Picocystis salinarum, Strain CCMP1897" /LENGTH=285 /DNA_ID=CAMNT_0026076025 /DNA_START=43 /DNA_END=900 /DNA_ORIENTATION=-
MRTFHDKVVVLTGASSGIGRQMALMLLQKPLRALVLVAREAKSIDRQDEGVGVKLLAVEMDLRHPEAGQELLHKVRQEGLRVDVLINCAGYGVAGEFHRLDVAEVQGMVDLNCRAVAQITHAFLPDILDSGDGAILNVASIQAELPMPLFALYAATKAFVVSFSQSLHYEYKERVTVLCVCPGPTTGTNFGKRAGIKVDNIRPWSSFIKVPVENADEVARRCIQAMTRPPKTIMYTSHIVRIMMWFARILPTLWLAVICRRSLNSSLTAKRQDEMWTGASLAQST